MIPADDFDRVLQAWVTSTSPVSAPPDLHRRAMAAVGARRQRVSWSATLRAATTDLRVVGGIRFGTAARFAALVALTLVAVVLISLAGAGGRLPIVPSPSPSPSLSPSPSPAPTPTVATATRFLKPFTFNQPAPDTLSWVTDTSDIQGFVDTQTTPSAEEYGEIQRDARRGVVVGALGSPWVHACGSVSDSQNDIRRIPAVFLEDLRSVGGVTTDPVEATTFDGRSALRTAIRTNSSRCTPDLHVTRGETRGSRYILMKVASQLTVLDVGGTTIVVDVWAQTDAELDAWLPTAIEFVDSIHFLDQLVIPPSARDFFEYLAGYGQIFTPKEAPVDAPDWQPAVADFPVAGSVVESFRYGTVSCTDPARNCAERGLVRPGEQLDIWLVTFEDSPTADGCPMWASVDARTGAFINGTGPPC